MAKHDSARTTRDLFYRRFEDKHGREPTEEERAYLRKYADRIEAAELEEREEEPEGLMVPPPLGMPRDLDYDEDEMMEEMR